MKVLKSILCTLLLLTQFVTPICAEGENEIQKSWFHWGHGLERSWSVTLGTGAGVSGGLDTGETSYFQRHDAPFGNTWRAEVRRKYMGMEYVLNYNSLDNDQLLTQYIAPTFTFPSIYDDNHQAWYLQASLGLLNYQQSIITTIPMAHNPVGRDFKTINFDKNYVAFGFGVGHEIVLHNRWALDTKLEFISADIFFNEDYNLLEALLPDDNNQYAEEEGETMFKGNLLFLHLTIALQLGW